MTCLCAQSAPPRAAEPTPCLGQLWLFDGLAPAELEALMIKAHRRRHEAGQAVFRQGERARDIYLIKSGRLRLSRTLRQGGEIVLDIRKPGDYLGEYLLNDLENEYRYPFSAWCLDEVFTCGFSRSAFEGLVLEHPALGLKVIKNLAGRLAALTGRLEAMSQTSLEKKLLGVLANVALEHGRKQPGGFYRLEMPLTHEDLGFLVGAHRVSVTRAIKRLQAAGRLAKKGRCFLIGGADMAGFTAC